MNTYEMNRRQALIAGGLGALSLGMPGMVIGNDKLDKRGQAVASEKSCIFVLLCGGPSHVDTFDYKPALYEHDGKQLRFDDARTIAKTGKSNTSELVMKPMWKYRRYGESGRWASDLFRETAKHSDDLTFIHSMHSEGVAHGPATLFLHCGSTNFIRPSLGSWVSYGLGTENENLPGFVSLAPLTSSG